MNAKEYFYRVVSPEQRGQSYQQFFNLARTGGSQEHVSVHSNDPLLDSLFVAIIARTPAHIRPFLQQSFVAKVHDWRTRAYVRRDPSVFYEGGLIFYHTGFSIGTHLHAKLFLDFCAVHTGAEPFVDLKEQWLRRAIAVVAAEQTWSFFGDGISLSILGESVFDDALSSNESAIALSTTLDSAILCHELSHHLLGHLGGENRAGDMLSIFPDRSTLLNGLTPEQKREMDADALGMLLYSGLAMHTFDGQNFMEAAMGHLLLFTYAGGFLSMDPNSASVTHPSFAVRFEQVKLLFNLFAVIPTVKDFLRDITLYQCEMERISGHGLGSRLRAIETVYSATRAGVHRQFSMEL